MMPDAERIPRVAGELFANQAVNRKRARKRNRYPGKAGSAEGKVGDCPGGNEHCQPLPPAQSLAQEEHAQSNREQRGDEVAKAGLQNLPVNDRVDENEPVKSDQHRAR